MHSYYPSGALADDRLRTLLAEAEASRLAKQARPSRHRDRGRPAARSRLFAGLLDVARLAVRRPAAALLGSTESRQ